MRADSVAKPIFKPKQGSHFEIIAENNLAFNLEKIATNHTIISIQNFLD